MSIQAQIINLLEQLREERGISYVFIAHDISMVKHISHKISVMYLGNIVETGDRNVIYKSPAHPYTKALLSAIPIPDPDIANAKKRIYLQGELPSPINPPSGCPFRTRCPTPPAAPRKSPSSRASGTARWPVTSSISVLSRRWAPRKSHPSLLRSGRSPAFPKRSARTGPLFVKTFGNRRTT